MRSSGLTLFVALVLCIQFGSVFTQLQEIAGTWSNPNASPRTMQANDFCCIPTSITIEKDGSGYTAKYEYDGIFSGKPNSQCVTLFLASTNTKLSLSKNSNGVSYAASASFVGIPLEVFTYTPTIGQLYISYSSNYSPNNGLPYSYYNCSFTMQTYKPPSYIGTIIFALVVLGSIGFCVWKKQQQKQANLIAQQKFQHDQQPYPAGAGIPNAGYVAPGGYPQQGYPQVNMQFNAGYPQQPMGMPMPNGQVTMNVNAGARPM